MLRRDDKLAHVLEMLSMPRLSRAHRRRRGPSPHAVKHCPRWISRSSGSVARRLRCREGACSFGPDYRFNLGRLLREQAGTETA